MTDRSKNISGRGTRGDELSLGHLTGALLVAGWLLSATVGAPTLPRASVPSVSVGSEIAGATGWVQDLTGQIGAAVDAARFAGASAVPSIPSPGTLEDLRRQLGTVWPSVSVPFLPGLVDLELFFRSPTTVQMDAGGAVLSWAAWLLWLWLVMTTVLRVVVVLGDRAAADHSRFRRMRAVSDRTTLWLVRQAVDASLASGMLLRAVGPAPQAIVPRAAEYAQVLTLSGHSTPIAAAGAALDAPMAPDMQPGDVFYTVQPGDTAGAIAELFYGDWRCYPKLVAANLDRPQPDGDTLHDAHWIRPGWGFVIRQPTQSVRTDTNGDRWYIVRAGDTLWGISARVLGDGRRWPELFALNQRLDLGRGHVLIDPDRIWPGDTLRLPREAPVEDDAGPAAGQEPDPSAAEPLPPTRVPDAEERKSQPPISTPDVRRTDEGQNLSGVVESSPAAPAIAETPLQKVPGQAPPTDWRSLPPLDAMRTDLVIGAGLGAAVLLALTARRRAARA
jgi:hypothetical protein